MSSRRLHTRGVLFALVALLFLGACRRGTRCATCGMRIDPASPWVSYLTIAGKEEAFDTPNCALAAWKKAAARVNGARFREYYSQELKPVQELRFVKGSDVVGPMGPDLVPVAPATAGRFARDHNGAPPQTAEEIVQGEAP
jgi:copper chaperone NosL